MIELDRQPFTVNHSPSTIHRRPFTADQNGDDDHMRRGPHPGPSAPRRRMRREHYLALAVMALLTVVVAIVVL
jgi:hypothetical protein